MQWTDNYQLFLFDFDGLLVNTELIHYRAYQVAAKEHGWTLPWSFEEYCSMAHYHAESLKIAMLVQFPGLAEVGWDVFYKQKTDAMQRIVLEGAVELMEGVQPLLEHLAEKGVKRAVVTHSPGRLVNPIREHHPILNSIPTWVTREQYSNPKPDPECYLKAIELLAEDGDQIVGFEDTPRGMKALMGTRAKPVIICRINYPEIGDLVSRGASHFESFKEINHL